MAKSNFDKIKEKIESTHYYRGKFISTFSALESRIEGFITTYFFGKDLTAARNQSKHDLTVIVLERMTFEAKRTSVKAIVDKISEENGFVKTKNNSYPHSKLFDEIRLLNDHRNYFAHYANLIFMKDGFEIEDFAIALNERRDKNQQRKYTEEEFNELIDKLHKAYQGVWDLELRLLK